MSLLNKLIAKDGSFFDLLEASAVQACECTAELPRLIAQMAANQPLDALEVFARGRIRDKQITNEIYEALSRSFVTPIDREDMQALTRAIYRIPKTVEKLGERLAIAPPGMPLEIIAKQAEAAREAAAIVSKLVFTLRNGPNLVLGRELNDSLQVIENDADRSLVELLRDLYQTDRPAGSMFAMRDIYDLCEKIVDRCRDAGNIVMMIMLKSA
jgi:hypothetical protein